MNVNFYRLASLTLAALATFFAWDMWRNRVEASKPAPTQGPSYQLQLPPSLSMWRSNGQLGEDIPYGGLTLPDTATWQTLFPDVVTPQPITIPDLALGWPNPAKIPEPW